MLEILLTLSRIFRDSGYELYMVGGAVRDLLLRRDAALDIDLATNARPDEIKRLVNQTHPAAVIALGEKFGTIRVHYWRTRTDSAEDAETASATSSPAPAPVVAETPADVDVIEITTYRSDRYDPDSRKP